MGFSRQEYWSGLPFPSPGDFPDPGIKPGSPTLQVDSLPSEPQGEPKNTGVGSLSLLQEIFLTQESHWGLLHDRRILYQLSFQGSPALIYISPKFLVYPPPCPLIRQNSDRQALDIGNVPTTLQSAPDLFTHFLHTATL